MRVIIPSGSEEAVRNLIGKHHPDIEFKSVLMDDKVLLELVGLENSTEVEKILKGNIMAEQSDHDLQWKKFNEIHLETMKKYLLPDMEKKIQESKDVSAKQSESAQAQIKAISDNAIKSVAEIETKISNLQKESDAKIGNLQKEVEALKNIILKGATVSVSFKA